MSYGSRRQRKVVVGVMIRLVLVFAGLAGCRSSTPVGESTPTLALTSSSFHEAKYQSSSLATVQRLRQGWHGLSRLRLRRASR
jgi:hypothetical protein